MKKISIAVFAAMAFLCAPSARADMVHMAARDGNLKLVKFLVKVDPGDVSSKDVQGWTPLHYAARGGHPEVCAFLLDHGADVNADAIGGTPLHISDNAATARLLLDRGAKIDARENTVGDAPLHSQALFGHFDVCDALLDRGADVMVRNNLGSTPLHHASTAGRLDVMNLLLDRGADIDARDNQGWTPLHWAAGLDRVEAVKILAKRGAELNPRDNPTASTPLHWAAGRGKKDMVILLLDLGADPNPRNRANQTPLTISRQLNYPEIAKILESRGGTE